MITAVASLVVPLGAYIYTRLPARSVSHILFLIFLLMGFGHLGMSVAQDARLIVLASWIQRTAGGLPILALVAWAPHSFPVRHRGLVMGFWGASFFASRFLNPLVPGMINGVTGGIVTTFAFVGAACLLGAFVVSLPRLYHGKAATVPT